MPHPWRQKVNKGVSTDPSDFFLLELVTQLKKISFVQFQAVSDFC